ncbi:replication factor C subunit 4 [Oratosquilla oratoria]|uniref:replication factor C subunit 4 n=1 Tax=Oratosquilla oratoria TaxID=337810 RepID=UPI003F7671AB
MNAFLKTGKMGSGPGAVPGPSSKTKTSERRKALTPWVEKYRPKSVDDVAYQDEVVMMLKKTINSSHFPNLLFYGPPGTGKTSTILAAASQLFGDLYHQRVLELNASDERGIQVIREKVKSFAQTTVSSTRPDGRPCPPYKIVILDEADSMTGAAQAALRRTMEKECRTTRFCLICNYVSRIIEPITSRCSKFRFKPLTKEIVMKRLSDICEVENVKCEPKAMECLIDTCEGDLRRAITTLQSVARLRMGENISPQDVYEITGVVPQKWINDLLDVCRKDSYEELNNFINVLMMEGYAASQLLNQLHDLVIFDHRLSDNQKAAICERIAQCDHRLTDGGDEFLQIMDTSCLIMKQLCHGK